ncbi:hypothetical protein WICPIJ_004648 [Wickerhamomyces pijperi]|uniref:Uncharacterized protein n=1 Tax=Wickerhamomyces pijperi TaxID=599730 RepID=A0A9P8Q7A0_WICPI|nr:hypothetical protein WICPIJ_004648 [Wickerhamomyces pijperi]
MTSIMQLANYLQAGLLFNPDPVPPLFKFPLTVLDLVIPDELALLVWETSDKPPLNDLDLERLDTVGFVRLLKKLLDVEFGMDEALPALIDFEDLDLGIVEDAEDDENNDLC